MDHLKKSQIVPFGTKLENLRLNLTYGLVQSPQVVELSDDLSDFKPKFPVWTPASQHVPPLAEDPCVQNDDGGENVYDDAFLPSDRDNPASDSPLRLDSKTSESPTSLDSLPSKSSSNIDSLPSKSSPHIDHLPSKSSPNIDSLSSKSSPRINHILRKSSPSPSSKSSPDIHQLPRKSSPNIDNLSNKSSPNINNLPSKSSPDINHLPSKSSSDINHLPSKSPAKTATPLSKPPTEEEVELRDSVSSDYDEARSSPLIRPKTRLSSWENPDPVHNAKDNIAIPAKGNKDKLSVPAQGGGESQKQEVVDDESEQPEYDILPVRKIHSTSRFSAMFTPKPITPTVVIEPHSSQMYSTGEYLSNK